MLGLVAVAMAMAVPTAEAGMATRIENNVSTEVLDSGLAAVWYEAFVGPDGTIEDCTVRAAIGDGPAANEVCKMVVGRHAKPAVGPDGKPTYGYLRGALTFADNYERVDPAEPDMALTVAKFGKPERVNLTVMVEPDGKVSACEAGDAPQSLARAACEQAKTVTLPARKLGSGEAVSYLFPMIVEFRGEKG